MKKGNTGLTLNSREGFNSCQLPVTSYWRSYWRILHWRLETSLLTTNILIAIVLLCCFFVQSVGAQELDAPNQKQIAKIEYYIGTTPVEETTEQLNILRNQTVVYVGDVLSRYAIGQSIKALYATQQYSQIQVYTQDRSGSLVLTYHLTPFAHIEQIVLSGIPENEVKNAIERTIRSRHGRKVCAYNRQSRWAAH